MELAYCVPFKTCLIYIFHVCLAAGWLSPKAVQSRADGSHQSRYFTLLGCALCNFCASLPWSGPCSPCCTRSRLGSVGGSLRCEWVMPGEGIIPSWLRRRELSSDGWHRVWESWLGFHVNELSSVQRDSCCSGTTSSSTPCPCSVFSSVVSLILHMLGVSYSDHIRFTAVWQAYSLQKGVQQQKTPGKLHLEFHSKDGIIAQE